MTLIEALELLDCAPTGGKSAINPNLTQAQSIQIVRNAAATLGYPKGKPCPPDGNVDPLIEKRVWQCVKNQKRPKY